MADTFSHYKAGLGSVGSYQVSGRPFMTGSAVGAATSTVEFPYVASSVTGSCTSANAAHHIKVHFANTADWDAGKHFITLKGGERMTFNVKCKEVFVTGLNAGSTYELSAELTNIESSQMYALTGAGLDTA
jgi:hypothetical protein